MDVEQHDLDRDLDRVPVSRLIGIADIAVLLGVKRATVDLWRVRDRRGRKQVRPLPAPLLPRAGDLTDVPLWDREEVLAWAAATGRLPEAAPALRLVPSLPTPAQPAARVGTMPPLQRPSASTAGLPPGRRGEEIAVFLETVQAGRAEDRRVGWAEIVAAYRRNFGVADNRAPQRAQTWLEERGVACVDWSAAGGENIVLGCPLVNPAPAVVADLLRERIRAGLWAPGEKLSRRHVTRLFTCTYTAATQGLEHLRDAVRPMGDEPLIHTVAGGALGRWVWTLTPAGEAYQDAHR